MTARRVERVANIVIARLEQPPERGPYAEHVEEITRRHATVERERPLSVEQRKGGRGPMRDGRHVSDRLSVALERRQLLDPRCGLDVRVVAVRPHDRDAVLVDNGKLPNEHRSKHVNIATDIPMPSARMAIAVMKNPGVRRKPRRANRRS
jgi:hypothetical protein